jgi:hypothetical protein
MCKWKLYNIGKLHCAFEFQITKNDLKSQDLGLYPKHKIFGTLFTLECTLVYL